ncbi:MAG: HAMP domain-containing methyl-accepting chemotaxis protein [Pseudomonadota bacterium]
MVSHITNRNEIIHDTLDALGPQIARIVEEVKLSIKGEQDTLGPQAVARMREAEVIELNLGAICLLFAAAASFVIARSITVPVRSMTHAMQQLAEGNLETAVPAIDYKDEIGDMAKTVQVFKDNALERQRLKSRAAEDNATSAEGQKQVSGIQSSTGEAGTAIEGIAATMEEVNTYTANIAAAVEEQDAATKEISRNAQQAAEGTTDVSANVADVSSAVVETRQSAEEMQSASATASEKSGALKHAVDQFLSRVAAA